MPSVIPDPNKIKSFRSASELENWLRKHHDRESELWLRIYKKDSGKPTVTYAEALEVVLCWGWIDGLKKAYDESSFLQRYSPRKPKSIWSHINREHVARLSTGREHLSDPRHRELGAKCAVIHPRQIGAAAPHRLMHLRQILTEERQHMLRSVGHQVEP